MKELRKYFESNNFNKVNCIEHNYSTSYYKCDPYCNFYIYFVSSFDIAKELSASYISEETFTIYITTYDEHNRFTQINTNLVVKSINDIENILSMLNIKLK